jgi:cytochrome P450
MTTTPVFDLDPCDPGFVRDPYPFYAAMRDLGRVFEWRQLGHRCCGRYDDVNAILRDRRPTSGPFTPSKSIRCWSSSRRGTPGSVAS